MSRFSISLIALAALGHTAFAQQAEPAPTPPPVDPNAPPAPATPEPAPAPPPPTTPPSTAPVATPVMTEEVAMPSESATVATGFAFEVRLETAQTLIEDDFALPTTQTGIFLGHRSESLTIGVGFELGRIAETTTMDDFMGGTSEVTRVATTVLFVPGIRFKMARTADGKTELLGQLDAGYGATFFSTEQDDEAPSIKRLRLQGGPAIRHWVSPSFAVGATGGLRYDRLSREGDDEFSSFEASLSNTTVFGSLQVTAVF